MQYKIIHETSHHDLQQQVNERLKEGWELAGGVSVAAFPYQDRDIGWSYGFIYAQALTFADDADI